MSTPRIAVSSGDIAQVPADALITAINSGGMWAGGIDGVIARNAGKSFHAQAAAAMPLQHGQVVVAKGNGENRGAFKNVVFVIDDLRGRLSDIVYNGLVGASKAGYASVTLPTIRMGVMLGVVEKSTAEAVNEMVDAVRRFNVDNPQTSIKTITFVVYNDAATELALKLGFQTH